MHRLREDGALEHLHRTSTRTRHWPALAVLAFDHRTQLEELAQRFGAEAARIADFKQLVARAARAGYAAATRLVPPGAALPLPGVIVDDRHGDDVLPQLTGIGWWVGRPVERPGSRPLAFEHGPNVALALRNWPAEHVVKCLVAHHPDDDASLRHTQLRTLDTLAQACHRSGHELLLEVIPQRELARDDDTLVRALRQIYAAGVRPDWWKLPPPADARAWQQLADVITHHDPQCRGVLLLGLEASETDLAQAFRAAAGAPLCKGFAVGRSIFADAAAAWFAGQLDDAGVIEQVADRYARLIALWCEARAGAATETIPTGVAP